MFSDGTAPPGRPTHSGQLHVLCFENTCAEGTLDCGGSTPPWNNAKDEDQGGVEPPQCKALRAFSFVGANVFIANCASKALTQRISVSSVFNLFWPRRTQRVYRHEEASSRAQVKFGMSGAEAGERPSNRSAAARTILEARVNYPSPPPGFGFKTRGTCGVMNRKRRPIIIFTSR